MIVMVDGNNLVKQLVSQAYKALENVEGDQPDDCRSIGEALGMLAAVLSILDKDEVNNHDD